MLRQHTEPRPDWPKRVESQGMLYHSLDDVPYWDESCYYKFSLPQIDMLERATLELNDLCLEAIEQIIDSDAWLDRLDIPRQYHDWIRHSWEHDEHTLYGRFDFAYDGYGPPKLLEYNADTPTSLLEAAVIQWHWLKDKFPHAQQFNSIHERLIEAFQMLKKEHEMKRFYFCSVDTIEDSMTVHYLRDVAIQAGIVTHFLNVEQIGWNAARGLFTDLDERVIEYCFKLYPWEWMLREEFGKNLMKAPTKWFEPPWKSLLSNKGILPVLWQLFPQCPYLLEASFEPFADQTHVRKPIFSREGANIEIYNQGNLVFGTPGPYDEGSFVYQRIHPLPCFEDRYYPIIGSWIVNGWSCGIGIREDESPVTGNLSRFVPHLFE